MLETELQKKYEEERDKRLRAATVSQLASFHTDADSAAGLEQDPFADYEDLAAKPCPLNDGDSIKFLIVGAGHNGILFAYRLLEAGFKTEDIVLVDNAGGFGGTWYWNRYPGLMCDVEGYCYLPLLEETGYMPKHRYSYGSEIRGQSERVAAKYNLRGMFCTKAETANWDEKAGKWVIKLKRNLGPGREAIQLTVQSTFLLSAGGVFYSPAFPDLPGFNDFKKKVHVFHTSRWDYKYTGGTQDEPSLSNLKDKRVGIIGTGATAIQVVPQLAKWSKELYVFQRTPSYCGPRKQAATTPEIWSKVANKAGWQYERQKNFNHFISDDPVEVDLVNDGWTEHRAFSGIVGSPKDVTPENYEAHFKYMFHMDVERSNKVRAHIKSQVKDPATAEKLLPWYQGWCKRPTFHDDYLPAFNQANVTLVDTDGQGVGRYTEKGVVANDKEYELDVLVLATGFFSSSSETGSPAVRMGAPVLGLDNQSLDKKWISEDFGTLFGIATHGFPNLFFYGASGTGASPNLTSAFDTSAKLVAHVVAEAHKVAQASGNTDRIVVHASKEAEIKYTEKIASMALGYGVLKSCTPGYFSGYPSDTREKNRAGLKRGGWGRGLNDYGRVTREYMAKEGIEGFDVNV